MRRLFSLFIFLCISQAALAISKTDIQVCEAYGSEKGKIDCYAEFEAELKCSKEGMKNRLSCYRKMAKSTIDAEEQAKKQFAQSKPIPLNIKFRLGGYGESTIHVDSKCKISGSIDLFDPFESNLRKDKLVVRVYPTELLLVCRDKDSCNHSPIRLAIDYGMYEENDAPERLLYKAVEWCNQAEKFGM